MVSPWAAKTLTARERDVVEAASGGAAVREIAGVLGISVRTVEHHLTSAYRKLGVRSRGQLIAQRWAGPVEQPTTRYARVGGSGVAYQVVGDGVRTVVLVPGFVSNVEVGWEWPALARFLRRLGMGRRLVVFDKLGTGLSDRLPDPAAVTMEERMTEVRAVMDAAGVQRATLFGFSEGAALSMLFAASHPERVNGLVLWGAMISPRFRDPHSTLTQIADDPEGTKALYIQHWGTGRILATAARVAPDDHTLLAHIARFERSGAGPADAHAIGHLAAALEMRSLVPTIPVPTLVLHRRGDPLVPVTHSQFLGEHLPYGRYVELPGEDHPPWLGEDESFWRELEPFLAVDHPVLREPAVTLETLVCTDPLLPPVRLPLLTAHDGRAVATRHGPAYAFDGPARALRFAAAVRDGNPHARIAVNCGQVTVTPSGLSGPAADVTAAALATAAPGEILVTRTVKDLVLGSCLHFEPARPVAVPDATIDTFTIPTT